MRIAPINNTPFKAREFGTTESLIKKDKQVVVIPHEVEQKLNEYMQELAEKRKLEEYKAIEMAKKIILNV